MVEIEYGKDTTLKLRDLLYHAQIDLNRTLSTDEGFWK